MRVAILSRNPKLYSTRRLVEAGTLRGHQVDVIDTMHCYMDITSSRPCVRYKGKPLPAYDAIIPRIGASVTFYGTAVVRQFEMMGTYCINESVAISRSRDKLRSLQLLSRKGVGLPRTGFAHHPDNVSDLIKNVGGAPVVIKLLEGTQGIGVVLAETQLLVGMGVDSLSLSSSKLLKIKYLIRNISQQEARDVLEQCLFVNTGDQIRDITNRYLAEKGFIEGVVTKLH